MSLGTGEKDKLNAWAQKEYQQDQTYWQDRAKNGTGLIKQIADIVIKQGAER